MKTKHIIGTIIAAIFLIIVFFSIDESAIEYKNFKQALQSGEIVQVNGKWIKEKDSKFDQDTKLFSFFMADNDGNTAEVIFEGGKPLNFDTAPSIVVKGKFTNNLFYASHLLTKCPSKYDGMDPEKHIGN